MDAATEEVIAKAKGRKDASGQEAIIKMKVAGDARKHLVKLLIAKQEAAEDYSAAIKAKAEAAGIQASVLGKYISAIAGEKYEEKKRDAEQLALCFDELGEFEQG